MIQKQKQRIRRHRRVRASIKGTSDRPRFCIFRSNKYIYGQLVDDEKGAVVLSQRQPKAVKSAGKLGAEIAKIAKGKNIEKVVFDRGGYKYHGRVKAVADEARKQGLKF